MNNLYFKNCILIICLTACSLCCLLPNTLHASSKLGGEASISYSTYESSDNLRQNTSSNSLVQHYSLFYEKNDNIISGRLGYYNLSIGYEWDMLDSDARSTLSSTHYQSAKGNFRYNGSILINPKEMPFRFQAYSRDQTRNTLVANENTNFAIPTQIVNGIHNESGATLVMGVKNGMSNGYNDLLRHLPMILIDYNNAINIDLSSNIDNRLNKLAFVSLNKKDNWFHYRLSDYKDHINPGNNYKESQIQLGTVDQSLQRRWVDFTNWLSVSVDGQLTRRMNSVSSQNYTEFDLNFFGVARRNSWDARLYSNFNRLKDEAGNTTYRTTLPVYFTSYINKDTSLATRASYSETHANANTGSSINLSAGYQLNAFQRAAFTITQKVDLDSITAPNSGDSLSIGAGLETASTGRFSRQVRMAGSYYVKNLKVEGEHGTESISHLIALNAGYDYSNKIRFSFNQTNFISTGTTNSSLNYLSNLNYPNSLNYTNNLNYTNSSGTSNSTFNSSTLLSMDWNPKPRLDVRISLNETIDINQESKKTYDSVITSLVTYKLAQISLSSTNVIRLNNSSATVYTISTSNTLNQTFNRNLNASIGFNYAKSSDIGSESDYLGIDQTLNYYYLVKGGTRQRLFEINESFNHTQTQSTNNSFNSSGTFSLGTRYYPIKRLLIGAGTQYRYINSFQNYSLSYYGSLGMNFRLFHASLDYSYGKTKTNNQIEKRMTANVSKSF